MKVTDVMDHYSEKLIYRPYEKAEIKFTFDFDFRKIGDSVWRYMDSSNDINMFDSHIKAAYSGNKGEYRIVNAFTNEVVKKG